MLFIFAKASEIKKCEIFILSRRNNSKLKSFDETVEWGEKRPLNLNLLNARERDLEIKYLTL
jgi:hypothetical protein